MGPIRSRRRAELAARALHGATEDELGALLAGGPLPRLRARLRELAEGLRYEDAARLRDRIAALEAVVRELAALERLRAAELCLLAPAARAGLRESRPSSPAGGSPRRASCPPAAGRQLEIEAGVAEARAAPPSLAPEDADELLLLGSFLRRPPPELTVVPLDAARIARACAHPRSAVA